MYDFFENLEMILGKILICLFASAVVTSAAES